jgi:RimJ/RimL family protein N-acetyltransferase
MYSHLVNMRREMHYKDLHKYCVVDYDKELVILSTNGEQENEKVSGIAQYFINENNHTAEIAFLVRDDYKNQGIVWELLSYITLSCKEKRFIRFFRSSFDKQKPLLHLF